MAAVAVLIAAAADVWVPGERVGERAPDLSVPPIELPDSSLVEPSEPVSADDS